MERVPVSKTGNNICIPGTAKPYAVPVLMYHAVAPERPEWLWKHLITPVDLFEGQMRLLKRKGWNTITLSQLYAHMKDDAPLPEKPVVLTFDDGYLDNWVYAFPVLKKYGHRAVVWMSTDFIDPAGNARPTMEDVWDGKISPGDLPAGGFLSWAEMRKMEESGVIEIQSHAKTHTWYYSGPEIIDYHRPAGADGYQPQPWLSWNVCPEKKYDYMSRNFAEDIPFGTPIYRHEKAMSARRYFPDERLAGLLAGHVAENGGEVFFEKADWKKELDLVVEKYRQASGKGLCGAPGRVETEAEYEKRIMEELAGSRRILSEGLGKDVRFLCWPGGAFNDASVRMASESGYLATTTHYLDPDMRNVYGESPERINRIGCEAPWVWRNSLVFNRIDPGFLISILEVFAGKKQSIWKMRCYKMKYLARYRLTGIR